MEGGSSSEGNLASLVAKAVARTRRLFPSAERPAFDSPRQTGEVSYFNSATNETTAEKPTERDGLDVSVDEMVSGMGFRGCCRFR